MTLAIYAYGVAVPKDEIMNNQLQTEQYTLLSHNWWNEKAQKKIWTK